jgi:hypothetical protein
LTQLPTEDWWPVTLELLVFVKDLVNRDEQIVTTYGEAFEVLRYLERAEVVELEPAEQDGAFNIRKKV